MGAKKPNIVCPFPHKRKGVGLPENGFTYNAPSFCVRKFKKNRCQEYYDALAASEELRFSICPQGFLTAYFKLKNEDYAISGMIDENMKNYLKDEVRKVNKKNIVSRFEISSWFESLMAFQDYGEIELHEQLKRSLQPYHDLKRFIGSITSNAEKLAKRQSPGVELGRALDAAPSELLSIHKTAEIMDLLTHMLDGLANPSLLKSGRLQRRGVYKSFDKIQKILSASAEERRVEIKFSGSSFLEIDAYSCFDILPFVLLDNAIKYSNKNQDVEVEFEEDKCEVTVTIINYGPLIKEDEIKEVFKLFVRGEFANTFSSEGAGIGLFLASEIVSIHSGKISLESISSGHKLNNIPLGKTKVILKLGNYS